jgi:hypothetical protein
MLISSVLFFSSLFFTGKSRQNFFASPTLKSKVELDSNTLVFQIERCAVCGVIKANAERIAKEIGVLCESMAKKCQVEFMEEPRRGYVTDIL